jgi:hypothetical protein
VSRNTTRPRKKIRQAERLQALESATELLNVYIAARASAANSAVEVPSMREKMEHLAVVEQYDGAIEKLVLIREVLDNSMHLARRLAQLLDTQ